MTLNGVIFRACTGWNKGNVANKSHGSTIRVTRVHMLKNLTVKQTQKIFLWKPRPFLFVISVSIAMHRLQIINQELKIYCQNCKSRKSLENWAWDAFVCNIKPMQIQYHAYFKDPRFIAANGQNHWSIGTTVYIEEELLAIYMGP